MISEEIPRQISYSNIIPKGFPSVFKEWDLDPLTNNKVWTNNDIVRFNFMNLGSGVFDPYRSYIEITVSTNTNDHPVGLLQIDNSAQSFINQTVLYSNNKQIQRITSYDTLASYLNDVGLNQLICEGRDAQGYGYGSYDTMPFGRSMNNNTYSSRTWSNPNSTTTVSSGNVFPTIGNSYPVQQLNINSGSIFNASKCAKGHLTNSNPVLTGTDPNNGVAGSPLALQVSMSKTGYANNIRGEYQTSFIHNKFPQTTQSIPNYQLLLDQNVGNAQYPFYFNQSIPYQVQVRNTYTDTIWFDTNTSQQTHTINCSNFGFTSLFTPFFSRGGFQPFISATVPQCSLNNGLFQPTKYPIYRRKFKIPLISGVMGVLIDPSQFKLLPLKSLNSCLLQITLDPYAMFTSGYNDVSQLDSKGILIQQGRNYHIQRIKYKIHTYHFIDSQVETILQTSLTKQIILTTNFWQLANQFQIPGGTPVSNNYIVGLSSTHLNELVCLFISNDYQTYSFARKHFRLSNNIRKYWSKLAVDYWPPQPYKGNGGNAMSNNEDDDNSNYVQNIYWTNGFMFSKIPLPRINQYNFAINERPYKVTNKSTYYDPSMLNNHLYAFTGQSINSDTAMGWSWLHENRCIGKAAYVISYTPFSNQDHVLQGINLAGSSNFQVLFDQDSNNTFPRDQTLYIFGKSSCVVKYTQKGIETFGR